MASPPVKLPSGAWAWLRARRGRMALAAAVVGLVALRLATPFVLERVIEAEASRALGRRVDVGDVDLSLLRGRVGLSRVYAGPLRTEEGADAPAGLEFFTPRVELLGFTAYKRVCHTCCEGLDCSRHEMAERGAFCAT